MGTLFDYITWRGDLSFDEAPLNEVDSLIFSLLSYVEYKDIVAEHPAADSISLQAAALSFTARNPDPKRVSMGLIVPKDIIKLLLAAKECRRFRRIGMKAYVNHIDLEVQTQFSAVTFCLENGDTVVAFRGTDDSLIGWKENFNMSFMDVVPAQALAKAYLISAAANCSGGIYVTGHSKGGNLAVYAAMNAPKEVKRRLLGVWNHDGPGFRLSVLREERYLEIKPLVKTLIPQSSLVGILLEHEESYTVVKSRQKGAWQHDALTWEVLGNAFVHVKDIDEDSKKTDRALKKWIESLSLEQRAQFCDALYQTLSSDNALTLTDLISLRNRWIVKGMKLDSEVHQILKHTLTALVRANLKNKGEQAASSVKETDQ